MIYFSAMLLLFIGYVFYCVKSDSGPKRCSKCGLALKHGMHGWCGDPLCNYTDAARKEVESWQR